MDLSQVRVNLYKSAWKIEESHSTMSNLDEKLGLENLGLRNRTVAYQRLIMVINAEARQCEDCMLAAEDASYVCVTHVAADFALSQRLTELSSCDSTPSPTRGVVLPELVMKTDPAELEEEEEEVICLGEITPVAMRRRRMATIPEDREIIELD